MRSPARLATQMTLLLGASPSGSKQTLLTGSHAPPLPSWCGTHRILLLPRMKFVTMGAIRDSNMRGRMAIEPGHNLHQQ